MGRAWVPIAGAIIGLVFVLTQLTGSDIDAEAAKTGGVAAAIVLFTAFGSVGAALMHWQPRFALVGAIAATLSLLACGATIVLTWDNGPGLLGFAFGGTGGTVAGITDLLAVAGAAICALLLTTRVGEDSGSRLARIAALGSLALLVALLILTIVVDDIEIGARVYAILAAIYAIATVVLLILRLLPLDEDPPAVST